MGLGQLVLRGSNRWDLGLFHRVGEAAVVVKQLLPQAWLTLKPTVVKTGSRTVSKLSEIGGFCFTAFILQLWLQNGFYLCLPRDASWLVFSGNLSVCNCIVRLTKLQTAASRTCSCLWSGCPAWRQQWGGRAVGGASNQLETS